MKLFFLGLALSACAYGANDEQVPIDVESFIPVTFGEIMLKVEAKAPIEDILSTCDTLKKSLQADIDSATESWTSMETTTCAQAAVRQDDVAKHYIDIDRQKKLINSTNGDIKDIAEVQIPAQKAIVDQKNQDINAETTRLGALANTRLANYKRQVMEQELYTSALAVMAEVKTWVATSSISANNQKNEDTAQADADAAAAPAPAFLEAKDRVVQSLRTQAAASSGIQQELLMHVAQGAHKSVDTQSLMTMLDDISTELQTNLALLRDKEGAEYDEFVLSHLTSRHHTNDLQSQVESARATITQLLKTEAEHAQAVSEFSSVVSDRVFQIEELEARINESEYRCNLVEGRMKDTVARNTEEIAAIDELVRRLTAFDSTTEHVAAALRTEAPSAPAP